MSALDSIPDSSTASRRCIETAMFVKQKEDSMRRLRLVSRAPLNTTRIPASAAAFKGYPDPSREHYKDCLDQQTTLGGKLNCFLDKLALAFY